MKPTVQRRLGKYVLLGRLGHGGMGKIYLAYAPGPGGIEKLLVIKRLHSHLTNDPVLVNSFLDEARLSMALSHPSIVHTYDVGEVDGRYFIVMEYIDGQNLGVLLRTAKRSGSYPDGTLWAGLFVHVLDALHAAHTARDARGRELHIIHRDVSPQNVLVTYDGQAKLVDFGIAKAALRISETDAGVLKGKYSYMSPEQCQSKPLDPRADVFSAGIVLWEMLAGRRLYKADSIVKSVERILTEPPISPLRVNPECDPELAKVALKALQKDREHRYSSAEEFRYALDEALHRGRHFRQSEVRDLMERLFQDVRARQQKLLEACLSGVAEAVDDENVRGSPNDSDSHVPVGSPVSESSSDVQMPPLGDEHEPTTPSGQRRSPLVTQDGEEDSKRAVIPPVGRVSSGAVTGEMVLPPSSTSAPHKRTSSAVLVAAGAGIGVLVLLVAGVVLGLVGGPKSGVDKSGEVELRAAQAPPDHTAADEQEARPDEEIPDPQAPAFAAATEAEAPAAPEARVKATEPSAASVEGDENERRARRPTRAIRTRRTSERRQARAEDEAVLKAADEKPPVEEPAGAVLTLETVPWSIVYLGKKRLGETPLVNVPVPSGELELLLVNPDKDIRQPYLLKAEPGKSYRRRLALE